MYIETTIPSYLTARPSRDLIIAGHQQITKDWWDKRRDAFQMSISQLVIDDVAAGDPGAAFEKMQVIKALPVLDTTPPANLELRTYRQCGYCQDRSEDLQPVWLRMPGYLHTEGLFWEIGAYDRRLHC